MARKTILWILLVLVSVGGVLYAFKYFPEAFPIVSLDLKMDRDAALESARSLAEELDWGPRDFKQAASFSLDERTQNYVELEAGGSDAFRRMLQEGLYEPYTWRVRHFAEGEANETAIRFMPEGDPYGFREKLPEDDPGASLTPEEACAIARDAATGTWGIDLSAYELVEESQKVQPGGRTDHTFVYERPDVQIGEGKYRLRLVVGGDKLTELMHFVKIPEAFDRRYEEMRSANNTISYIGVLGIVVLYFLGGCVVGLIILLRQRAVLWRKALLWGMSIALLQVLTQINRWPLAWMDYDTALSSQGYLLQQILQLLIIFAAEGILLTVTFMAAESLTRKAFPDHIQLWRLWSPGAASSKPVLGRTIGGYLSIGFSLGFVVAVYFVSSKFLGWWTPSGALFEPDVLATYCPWLSSIAISLHAGFWEECLFRAVPLAGAALIGQRLGHRRAWIIGALIIQALIFGAGHASYATQPAYARVVELIIPSFVFAGIYLRFGLLPAIISHFTFDVVWFALPLFVASSSGIWVDQILVILLTLIPLWVVLIAGLRAGRWGELRDDFYNRMWQPSVKAAAKPVAAELSVATEMKGKNHGLLLLGGLVGLILWFLATDFQTDAPPITTSRGEVEVKARETLTEQGEAKVKARETLAERAEAKVKARETLAERAEAKVKARETLAERGVILSDSWRVLSRVETPLNQDDRFIWQEGGKDVYDTLMSEYISAPCWKVRFAQFEGDVAERAEEYQVWIDGNHNITRIRHKLPEGRSGATIPVDEARALADSVIAATYGIDPFGLKEISAKPLALPDRQDWEFVFSDTAGYPLGDGEARITVGIAGDEPNDTYRHIHVPEEWEREERDQRNTLNVLQIFCATIQVLLILAGIVGALVSWGRKHFSVPAFSGCLALLLGLRIIEQANGWPATVARFSTAEPFSNQVFSAIAFSLLGSIVVSLGIGLLAGFIHKWRTNQPQVQGGKTVGVGYAVGFLAVGLLTLIKGAAPSFAPTWANYQALNNYLPILSAGLNPVAHYITTTVLMLLLFTAADRLSKGWTQRKPLTSVVLISLGLILAGSQIDSVTHWLLTGVVTGIILFLAYRIVLRFGLALVPLAVAPIMILGAIKEAIYGATVCALPGATIVTVLCVLVSIYWFKKMNATAER